MNQWDTYVSQIKSFIEALSRPTEEIEETSRYEGELETLRIKAEEAIAIILTGTTPAEHSFKFENAIPKNTPFEALLKHRNDYILQAKESLVEIAKAISVIPELSDFDWGNLSSAQQDLTVQQLNIDIAKCNQILSLVDTFEEMDNLFSSVSGTINKIFSENQRILKTVGEVDQTIYNALLNNYGEILTRQNLAEFFKCDTRTVSNWEKAHYIESVEGLNTGVRGRNKRYSAKTIASSDFIQRRYRLKLS